LDHQKHGDGEVHHLQRHVEILCQVSKRWEVGKCTKGREESSQSA
jgi:hypothetical protein